MKKGLWHGLTANRVLHIVLIATLGLVAYSNTFNVPFQLDERVFITENPIVKDLRYFADPSLAKGFEQYGSLKNRYVGYLTFALNYRIHGTDVRGYHVVNIAIHILNAMLLYALVLLSFRTPFLRGSPLSGYSRYVALFAGLLFVSHPLQTEAVTYVFQRLASLMAFFYIFSLVMYIRARLSGQGTVRYALYAVSFFSAVLAMKTKENALTLPLVVALYEFLFWDQSPLLLEEDDGMKRHPGWKRVLPLVPLFLIMLIVPITIVGGEKPVGEMVSSLGSSARGYAEAERGDYLKTQFPVITKYTRLLFLPLEQNFDYDQTLYRSIFTPKVFYSFVFVLFLFGFAVWLVYRSEKKGVDLRLVGYGILWFFITLLVESSIIPLPTIINEYRVYLPSAGALLAVATYTFIVIRKQKLTPVRMGIITVTAVIPLVLCYAAYARNSVWESRVTLWKDVVEKSPHSVRARNNLANAYWEAGFRDKAIANYMAALDFNPDNATVHNNLGLAYDMNGLSGKAIKHFSAAVRVSPGYANAYYNLGRAYERGGFLDNAIEHYKAAVEKAPEAVFMYNALGVALEKKGLVDDAMESFRIAVMLDEKNADAHYNLGNIYWSRGSQDMAIEHFLLALESRPDFIAAHNNLGFVYCAKGMDVKAIGHFQRALVMGPDVAGTHYNLGMVYLKIGMIEKAREELVETLRINPDFSDARMVLNSIIAEPFTQAIAGVKAD